MKFQISAALLGLAATSVSAQDIQTGPFTLSIKGTNPGSTIDGTGYSCHTGAALSGICYTAGVPAELTNSYQYYFNYTGYTQVGGQEVGLLVWNQQFLDQDGNTVSGSQSLELLYQSNSNVAATQISYTSGGFLVGFDESDELFGYNYIDDSKFVAGQQPTDYEGKAYYQWVVCWQYYTGYYYQSLGWVLKGAPSNPTCEPVEITKTALTK